MAEPDSSPRRDPWTVGLIAASLILGSAGAGVGGVAYSSRPDPFYGSDGAALSERIAKLESESEYIKTEQRELRADNRQIREIVANLPPDPFEDRVNEIDRRVRDIELSNAK